ncbi:hypothetical protein K4K53_002090 [Colletotrichum sp. SAR 10_77]|nr:hypothetical protein K4K51_012508 [Colletotrichum sp. SAR 10_75]KAI8247210.1 hypothetical protein K4K53_002090 [Colletotrichum sp. SAR 10_77]KAJ5005335.1 hypothetical protein K4K48_007550 [Colletotrichum sp. SAR 10_66]
MSPPPPEKGKAQVPQQEESKSSSSSNRNGSPDATDVSPEAEDAGPDLSVFDPEFVRDEPKHPQVGQSELAESPTTKVEEQYRRRRFEYIAPQSPDSGTLVTPQAADASTPSETAVKGEDSSNEEGSSGTHDEDLDENEDPSKTVQRMMVDSVMTSFMDWLDVKLKVKGEEEKEDLSSLPLLGAPQPMTEGLESTISPRFTAPMPVPTGFAPIKSSIGAFGSGQTSGTDKTADSYIIIHEKQSSIERPELSKKEERAEDIEAKRAKLGELRATREGLRSHRGIHKESLVQSLSALRTLSLSEETAEDERDSTMPVLASPPPPPAPKAKSFSFSNLLKRSKKKSVEESEEEKKASGLEKAEEKDEDEDEDDEEILSGEVAASETATSRGGEAVEELMAYPPGVLDLDSEPRGSPPPVGGPPPTPAVSTSYEAFEEKQPPSKKFSKEQEDEVSGAKLACPFFKHNPRKYKNQRPCCGPGWDHVHRIKERIYRKHSLPKFSCPRCSQPFETQADLQAHARLPTPCQVKEPEVLDGITQDQEKKLRSRKKTSGKELTEAEKWAQVYSILFPDVREREIPSPYYNTEDAQTNLGGYEDYLRRELPTQVRRQLEKEVEQQLSFVEEGMKQKVIEIARNLQLSLFKSYQQIETQERDTEGPSPSAGYISSSDFVSFTATDTSPSTMTTAGTTPEMPDPLEIFGGDPAIPDFNFDFLSQDPSAQSQGPEKSSDSAFGIDPYATSGPPTIQPGMEMFGGQQFGMSYYDVEGYDERQGTVRDMSVLSYAP